MKNFDNVFGQAAAGSTQTKPNPSPAAAEVDLSHDLGGAARVGNSVVVDECPTPVHMSEADFKQKFANPDATITLNLGGNLNVTCFVVGSNAYITSSTKVILPGVHSGESAKPIFMYAGGSWISESAKASQQRQNHQSF